jgi:pyruvate dehydrogenase E2 component (dihydrolipoamide acetyltransferase)
MHAANDVIMPVLGMNQDTGKIIRWLVVEGQPVKKGDPLLEVETDKAVAEIESPATGILSAVTAQDGEDVPVGKIIAVIALAGQSTPSVLPVSASPAVQVKPAPDLTASPLAARMAAENHLDLAQIRPQGGRVEKGDVLAYLKTHEPSAAALPAPRPLASPKARRLAAERGLDLFLVRGSGPDGAILAADIPAQAQAALQTPALAGQVT